MCGILCLLSLTNRPVQISNDLLNILKNRGPDVEGDIKEYSDLMNFYGFVLWQQGEKVYSQPAVSESYILLLNGDIFNANKSSFISDTEWLLYELQKCDTEDSILNLIASLEGPFSIIFYNRKLNILYFARDPLGRNSLLVERDCVNGYIKITSTSSLSHKDTKCIELPPVGVYKIFLGCNSRSASLIYETMELFTWKNILASHKEDLEKVFGVSLVEREVKVNVKCLEIKKTQNYFNFYELINNENFNLSNLLENEKVASCIDKVIYLLKNSLRDRILNTPQFCADCIALNKTCNHSKIGILFSGGLDCSILARLSHEFCKKSESIDLINVAFENVNSKDEDNIDWNTPDRLTALRSYDELIKLIPERNWNLIQVNITRKNLSHYLSTRIKHLIYPLNTVLDESLGASFWFASRGIGLLNNESYQTTCRVVLIGSGADELFGGYTRHRNAFTRTQSDLSSKIEAVGKELEKDWERIAFRNLGRDDRVIADNCKTARSPYIEENFVNFVTNLCPEQKCCFTLNQGRGDKLLLRLCGLKLNLIYSSTLQKRAIQFGSKIANKKQSATDVSKYLTHSNSISS